MIPRRGMVVGRQGMVMARRGMVIALHRRAMAAGFMARQRRPEPIAIFLQMSNRPGRGVVVKWPVFQRRVREVSVLSSLTQPSCI